MSNRGLAMIANCMTPYRAHLHALVAEGIPELKLHTLITHGAADFDWAINVPPAINTQYFNEVGDSALAGVRERPHREWRKGARLINYLLANDVRAVICTGYRYLSYLRLIDGCYRRQIPLFLRNDSNIRSDTKLSPTKQFFKRKVYDWWIPKVAGIMSMGEYGDQFFIKYGADPRLIYRVPYTPDYSQFAQVDEHEKQAFSQQFQLDGQRRRIIYSGRLVPVKRVDLLIDAFASIAGKRSEWDLMIVGDGVDAQVLRARVPVELRDRVIWTSFLETERLVAAYHSADLLVLPSDYEPWALVVQEALAAGLPVIASDVVGAAHELVADGKNGRIFPAGNREVLVDALMAATCIENLERYRGWVPRALDDWRAQVDPVANIRRALMSVGVLTTN